MENIKPTPDGAPDWKAGADQTNGHTKKISPREPFIIEGDTISYGGKEFSIKPDETVFGSHEVWHRPE